MKASIKVDLQPFSVPNFVLTHQEARPRQEGITETVKFALSELDADTLERLCQDFRKAVFEKASIPMPPRLA